MDALIGLLESIHKSGAYFWALVFFGAYPVFMALAWIVFSLTFRQRTEDSQLPLGENPPMVTILVPAYCEEKSIGETLEALLRIDYPKYEIVVVNDASTDRTQAVVQGFLRRGTVRLVDKKINEGKAMALNDALHVCRGEILLIVDADIIVEPDVLRWIAPHFTFPRVAAVTGNPRVRNRRTLLQNLQAIEFSAIVSMQRRAQRVWGRVLTVTGAAFAVRKSVLMEVGGFHPAAATEDIDMTWRLQLRFWDIRYEPRAVVWMEAPPSLSELWKQRSRWATGLAQVLKRHGPSLLNWKARRLWPVFIESSFSILWAYTFMALLLFWTACLFSGVTPYGLSPVPNLWGMTIATACLVQLLVGALSDRRYDPTILRSYPEAILYPLLYWVLLGSVSSVYTLRGFFSRMNTPQRWKTRRSTA